MNACGINGVRGDLSAQGVHVARGVHGILGVHRAHGVRSIRVDGVVTFVGPRGLFGLAQAQRPARTFLAITMRWISLVPS